MENGNRKREVAWHLSATVHMYGTSGSRRAQHLMFLQVSVYMSISEIRNLACEYSYINYVGI